MAIFCPAPDPAIGLVQGLIFTVDCNVQGTAQSAYAALAQPGSTVSTALFALLTIYVAFVGYRLILGRSPLRAGDLTVSVLKIGLVVLLATNWGAYQTLVYDTLARGPGQVAQALLTPLQPAQSVFRGDPFLGLQVAFDQLQLSAASFTGRAGASSATLQGGPGFAAFALNASSYLLLTSTLGVVLASHIVLAILLGLAPLFAAFLLFEPTRGLVEGWLKAAIATALAPMLATLALAIELLMLEPGLLALATARSEGRYDLASATSIFMLALIFTGVLAVLAAAGAATAWGLRLPRLRPAPAAAPAAANAQPARAAGAPVEILPRAAAVAGAVAAADRRDSRFASVSVLSERRTAVATAAGRPEAQAGAAVPLGRSYRRPAAPRRSAAAARRDP